MSENTYDRLKRIVCSKCIYFPRCYGSCHAFRLLFLLDAIFHRCTGEHLICEGEEDE